MFRENEQILVLYQEGGIQKKAAGILLKETDTEYVIQAHQNTLSIGKKFVIKAKQGREDVAKEKD